MFRRSSSGARLGDAGPVVEVVAIDGKIEDRRWEGIGFRGAALQLHLSGLIALALGELSVERMKLARRVAMAA